MTTQTRQHFIDNLRWLGILLLFPYHTFMVYNNFGESFYVWGGAVEITSRVIVFCSPWLMPLMFALAGISSAYALRSRSAGQYLQERAHKLLIPLVFGLLLLAPMQTYVAEVFHNGYKGGYLAQYVLFFTKPTDLSGYYGGFTPGHLWFLLYLFVISLVALPLMLWYNKRGRPLPVSKLPLFVLVLGFIIPVFSQALLDISGKSVGEYLTYFLLGFFILSNQTMIDRLARRRFVLLGLCMAALLAYTLWYAPIAAFSEVLFELLYAFAAWTAVLAAIALGKQYLNRRTKLTAYFSAASFGFYIFHQQWVVIAAFFALKWISSVPLQMLCIILASFVLTWLNYELFRRIPGLRWLFGLRAPARGSSTGRDGQVSTG